MDNVKAFGRWPAEALEGNPFSMQGCLKVLLSEPKIPLILDTTRNLIAFITVRVASSERFILPKSSRSEEEKKRAVYYAIYTSASEWEIIDGGYSPAQGSTAEALTKELLPPAKSAIADPGHREVNKVNSDALRDIISQSKDKAPYVNFPLSQRQMIEQAANLASLSVQQYVERDIPLDRRQWAYARFGIDIRAMA